jgi:excinuclease ABC subunit B
VLYADKITGSMQRAMDETDRRRARQSAHNEKFGITPISVAHSVMDVVGDTEAAERIKSDADRYTPSGQLKKKFEMAEDGIEFIGDNLQAVLADLEKRMFVAAENLEFEEAAKYRDQIQTLTSSDAK